MPHTTKDIQTYPPKSRRYAASRSSPRKPQQLSATLDHLQQLYSQSFLSKSIHRHIQTSIKNTATPISRVLSLGLGSLQPSKHLPRRLKQLTILLAVRNSINQISGCQIAVYAQDPTFTRNDEAFLTSLDIQILRTPSVAELGEAATVISPLALVYCPFLTIEAYGQLLVQGNLPIPNIVFGDDFDALLDKWPKHSAERKQVDVVMKAGLLKYKRRAVGGEGFWTEGDGGFPMAVYEYIRRRGE